MTGIFKLVYLLGIVANLTDQRGTIKVEQYNILGFRPLVILFAGEARENISPLLAGAAMFYVTFKLWLPIQHFPKPTISAVHQVKRMLPQTGTYSLSYLYRDEFLIDDEYRVREPEFR